MDEAFWQKNLNQLTIPILKSLLEQNEATYNKNEKKVKLLSLVISVILSKKLLNCDEETLKLIKLPEELKRKFIIYSTEPPALRSFPSSPPKVEEIKPISPRPEIQKEESNTFAFLDVIMKGNEPKPEKLSIKDQFLSHLFDGQEEEIAPVIDVVHIEPETESNDLQPPKEPSKQEFIS
jgi:hypothetical protein